MEVLTKEQFLENFDFYSKEILSGKIFVFPTDTIYGIGCNATNKDSVNRIRVLKKREKKPFAIFAPSKTWIKNHCSINLKFEHYLEKLPGKFTFIFNLKENHSLPQKELLGEKVNVGIRIPDNWFAQKIATLEIPFVGTSVNLSGEEHISKIDQIPEEMKDGIDYVVDVGEISGKPSTIIDLSKEEEIIIRK